MYIRTACKGAPLTPTPPASRRWARHQAAGRNSTKKVIVGKRVDKHCTNQNRRGIIQRGGEKMGALEKLIERIREWPEARITELQQIVDELEPKMEPGKAVTE